jgi:DNA-binding winged helix-turn-helix (wHTH) protein
MATSSGPASDGVPIDGPGPADDAGAWRFGEFELDGGRRVLTRSGRRVRLSTRAFDVLQYLVRHRHRVVAHSELLARCWPRPDVTDGVVARVVMSVRKALSELDPQHGLIQTSPRAGYRFVAASVACALAGRGAGPRLAVLPVDDCTADASLGWAKLGLASLLGARLADCGVDGLASVREVLVVLNDLPDRVGGEQRVRHVMQALGARAVLETRLVRQDGRCLLHLALHADEGGAHAAHEGSVVADDAADTADPAAALVARWIAAPDAAARAVASGDAFLDEAWHRALRCLRADKN